MDWQYAALLAVPLFVLVFVYRRRTAAPKSPEFPYVRRAAMFSPAERAFFRLLDLGLGKDYRLFAKVRVADVLLVPKGGDKAQRMRPYIRIAAKHFDYLLCYHTDLRPVCAIELTDFSNSGDEGRARHAFLSRACRVANFPLVTFDAQRSYSPATIRQTVLDILGTNLPFPMPESMAPAESIPDRTLLDAAGDGNSLPDMAEFSTRQGTI